MERRGWGAMAALMLAAWLGGCDAAGPASSPDLETVAAPDLGGPDLAHPPTGPMILDRHGGAVLPSPEPWVFVWQGDEANGQYLADFFSDLFADGRFWGSILAQYGVGAGHSMGLTVLPSPAPSSMTVEDLGAMVDTLAVTRTANTVVALLVPPTTTLTDVPDGVGGFHTVSPGGTPFLVVFEVAQAPSGFRSPLDIITIGASHELSEAATDPFPPPLAGAWIDDQLDTYGEVADLCVPLWNLMPVGKSGAAAPSGDYGTSKFYSNAAATAGAAITCLPNFVKDQPGLNVQVAPQSVSLAPGESATLYLTFVSDGDPGAIDWDIDTPLPAGVAASALMGTTTVDGVVTVTLTANASFEDFPVAVFVQSESDTYSHGVYWVLVKSR